MKKPTQSMRKAKVMVIESLEGEVKIVYKGKFLEYKEQLVKDHQGRILNRKSLLGGSIPKKELTA